MIKEPSSERPRVETRKRTVEFEIPAPPPAVAAVRDGLGEAGGEGDAPLQDTGIHRVANWPYGPNDPGLRQDGQYWVDARTREQRLEPSQQYYGADWMREALTRQITLALDPIYRFVSTTAGLSSRGARTDIFWKSSATGGALAEAIVSNLYSRMPGGGPGGGGGGDGDPGLDATTRQLASRQLGSIHNLMEKLADSAPPSSATTSSAPPRGPARNLQDLAQEEGVPAQAATNEANAFRTGLQPSVMVLPNPVSAPPASAPPPPVPTDLQRQYKALDGKGDAEKIAFVRGQSPRSKALQDAQVLLLANEQIREASAAIAAYERYQSGAAGPPGGSRPSGPALASGAAALDPTNPRHVLMKMVNDHELKETQLKAFDLLYAGGELYYKDKAKKGDSAAIAGVNIDWTNPKEIGALLEAVDRLSRMLQRGEGGLDWRRAAENLGFVFLSDHFRANLLRAHAVLKVHCPLLKEVPVLDLMTHEDVWFEFAQFVSYCIRNQDHAFPTRAYTTQAVDSLDHEAKTLRIRFERVDYGPDGLLHFMPWDEAGDQRMRLREAKTRRRLERGGGGSGGDEPRALSVRPRRVGKPQASYDTPLERRRREIHEASVERNVKFLRV
jgi:hypothetical protein